jgi:CrcB protein
LSQLVAIAAGGAVGAVARFVVSNGVYGLLGRDFPYGTLVVNVAGSVLMGLLYVLFMERLTLGPEWRAVVLVGFLGSFTTFSTFSMETVTLLENQHYTKVGMNIVLSVLLCVVGAWLGVIAARRL